jgi:hypothetical protein
MEEFVVNFEVICKYVSRMLKGNNEKSDRKACL